MHTKKSKPAAKNTAVLLLRLLSGALINVSLAAPGDVDLSFHPGRGVAAISKKFP